MRIDASRHFAHAWHLNQARMTIDLYVKLFLVNKKQYFSFN
jgi:hypothetical protein